MKRTLSLRGDGNTALVPAAAAFVACTYGLVRLAYGLFLPDIQVSLTMSTSTGGLVSSAASMAYCAGALCGLAATRWSRPLVLAALLTASAGSVGMAAAEGLAMFSCSTVVASCGAGLASPALVVVVARHVSSSQRDRAQATVNAGTGPGLIAAGLLALVISPHWRMGLMTSALVTAVVGAAVLSLDHPTPGWNLGLKPTPDHTSSDRHPGREPVRIPSFVLPATAALVVGATSAVVWTFARTLLLAHGMSPTGSTTAWIALGVGGLATILTAPGLARLSLPRAWATSVLTMAAAIAVLGLWPAVPWVAVTACAVFGWGFVAVTSTLIRWAGLILPDRPAVGTSIFFVTLVLGQSLGSASAGNLIDHTGLAATFLTAAVLTVPVALLAAGSQRSNHHSPPAPRTASDCVPGPIDGQ